jgi:hypothetical protein
LAFTQFVNAVINRRFTTIYFAEHRDEKISNRISRIYLGSARSDSSGDDVSRSKSHRFAGSIHCRYPGHGND